jgi:hypothetical protein
VLAVNSGCGAFAGEREQIGSVVAGLMRAVDAARSTIQALLTRISPFWTVTL